MSTRNNWCIHYCGMIGRGAKTITHCEAGVKYLSVRDDTKPGRSGFPCFSDNGISERCEKCQYPTEEEIAEENAATEKSIACINKARAGIVKATVGKRGVSGEIECPACLNGRLRYSVSGHNGHIHASCSNQECVRWME